MQSDMHSRVDGERRSSGSSSSVGAAFWTESEPQQQDVITNPSRLLEDVANETSMTDESVEENDTNSYVPNFEGLLTLGFSLYLPDLAHDFVALTQQNKVSVHERLDSIMLLFLCSRDVDLVISPNSDSVVSICPFGDNEDATHENVSNNGETRRSLTSFLQNLAIQWRRTLQSSGFDIDDHTGMVLWNVPKVENEVFLLGTSGSSSSSSAGSAYYTQWNFTYPVYNWGSHVELDSNGNDQHNVQYQLDDSIRSGTFDAVLSWETAESSVVGQESKTFANGSYYDGSPVSSATPTSSSDYVIPYTTAKLLQGIGTVLVVANAIFVIILTILAKRHRIRKENEAKQMDPCMANGLDTEEGVSEMLMESKRFAMEKSLERRQTRSTSSITVGPNPLPLSQSKTKPRMKEQTLVDKAMEHKKNFTEKVFNDKLLANLSMEEDENDDLVDFRPPSPVSRSSQSKNRRHSQQHQKIEKR